MPVRPPKYTVSGPEVLWHNVKYNVEVLGAWYNYSVCSEDVLGLHSVIFFRSVCVCILPSGRALWNPPHLSAHTSHMFLFYERLLSQAGPVIMSFLCLGMSPRLFVGLTHVASAISISQKYTGPTTNPSGPIAGQTSPRCRPFDSLKSRRNVTAWRSRGNRSEALTIVDCGWPICYRRVSVWPGSAFQLEACSRRPNP